MVNSEVTPNPMELHFYLEHGNSTHGIQYGDIHLLVMIPGDQGPILSGMFDNYLKSIFLYHILKDHTGFQGQFWWAENLLLH